MSIRLVSPAGGRQFAAALEFSSGSVPAIACGLSLHVSRSRFCCRGRASTAPLLAIQSKPEIIDGPRPRDSASWVVLAQFRKRSSLDTRIDFCPMAGGAGGYAFGLTDVKPGEPGDRPRGFAGPYFST